MVLAQRLLTSCKDMQIQRLALIIAAFHFIQRGEVVEGVERFRVLRAEVPLAQGRYLVGEGVRLGVLAVLKEVNRSLVEGSDQVLCVCGWLLTFPLAEYSEPTLEIGNGGLQRTTCEHCGRQHEHETGDPEIVFHRLGSSPRQVSTRRHFRIW